MPHVHGRPAVSIVRGPRAPSRRPGAGARVSTQLNSINIHSLSIYNIRRVAPVAGGQKGYAKRLLGGTDKS